MCLERAINKTKPLIVERLTASIVEGSKLPLCLGHLVVKSRGDSSEIVIFVVLSPAHSTSCRDTQAVNPLLISAEPNVSPLVSDPGARLKAVDIVSDVATLDPKTCQQHPYRTVSTGIVLV